MTDREAETLPPDSFTEPADARDTEPPVSPAIIAALRQVLREELPAMVDAAVARSVGAVAKQWGDAFVAEHETGEETRRIAENAIKQSAENARASTNALLSVNENLRGLRAYLNLPEHGSIAELAKQAGQ